MGMGLIPWLWTQAVFGAGPMVGQEPPLLTATGLLQAPPGASVDAASLRGKVVVLEFWATTCGPCVSSFPHLNKLADAFKDKPVQFISITEEDEATVTKFLRKRPLHTWVALDGREEMFKAYGIHSIPHTIIIGTNGIIAAITYPISLTAEHIDDLLAGKKITVHNPYDDEKIMEDADRGTNARPVFQLVVRPSSRTNCTAGWTEGQLNAHGYTVGEILPVAFNVSPARIVTNCALPAGRFDFSITQPRSTDEAMKAMLRETLRGAFHIEGVSRTDRVDALVLRVKTPGARGLEVSPTPNGSTMGKPGHIEGTGVSMASLAMMLEYSLRKPVFDETGLKEQYDLILNWDASGKSAAVVEAASKALQEQLGLELAPEKRRVGIVRIEQAKTAGATGELQGAKK